MDIKEIIENLKTINALLAPVAAFHPATETISTLVGLSLSAAATAQDSIVTWNLVQRHTKGEEVLDQMEAEVEAMEARGLKPVEPEED